MNDLMNDFNKYERHVIWYGIDETIQYIYSNGFCWLFSYYMNKYYNCELCASKQIHINVDTDDPDDYIHSFNCFNGIYFDINGIIDPKDLNIVNNMTLNDHLKAWEINSYDLLDMEHFIKLLIPYFILFLTNSSLS